MPLKLEHHTDALLSAGAPSFQSVDELDEAYRELGQTMEYRQLERGCGSASFIMSEQNGMLLIGEYFRTRVQIVGEAPRDAFSFVIPITGGADCRMQGQVFDEESFLSFPPGSKVDIITPGAAGDLQLTIADVDLHSAAALLFPGSQLFARPEGQSHLVGVERLDAVSVLLKETLSGRRADPESLSELLVRCIALVADSASTVTNQNLLGNDAKWKVLARALEFIDSHLTQPVRLEDLCGHARAGVRVLQRVFRERLGVSPTEYIKARRLNAARRLLAAGVPPETTVSKIARQCGFTHLGRFSVDYRSHFGELPRQTLRR